jgi:hypothetical protein
MEYLLGKCEALGSNTNLAKKKKKIDKPNLNLYGKAKDLN